MDKIELRKRLAKALSLTGDEDAVITGKVRYMIDEIVAALEGYKLPARKEDGGPIS